MCSYRKTFLVALALTSIESGVAMADADEMVVTVGAIAGNARTTDRLVNSTQNAGFLGGAGSISYATRDWFRYEVSLGFSATEEATFEDVNVDGVVRDLKRAETSVRALAGVTGTFGIRWIPTLTLMSGVLWRRPNGTRLVESGFEVGPGPGNGRDNFDVIVGVGAGLTRRFGRRWALGVNILGVIEPVASDRYQSIEGSFSLGYHFYP